MRVTESRGIFRAPFPIFAAIIGAAICLGEKNEKPVKASGDSAVAVAQSTVSAPLSVANAPIAIQLDEANKKTPKYERYEKVITEKMLRDDLTFLADDKHEGRVAGGKHLENEVTQYIERIFRECGLKGLGDVTGNYKQEFIIDWKTTAEKIEGNPDGEFEIKKKYVLIPISNIPKVLSYEAIRTHNLVALLEGSDEKLKDEYIVLCAHMDHLGINKLAKPGEDFIFNGADDNASGVSVILSVIRAFAQAKKEGNGPKRSLIILFPSAEEMGALGSKYFVENPPIPLGKQRAAINLDMVGRRDPSNCISVIDTNKDGKPNFFHDLHDALLCDTGIEHVNHDIESLRRRSDQARFEDKDILFLYIGEGPGPNNQLNEDYHKVTDEALKINFLQLRQVAIFSFRNVWKALNKENLFQD